MGKRLNYRERRTTIALANSSARLREAPADVREGIKAVVENNFDLETSDDASLEGVFAYFDDDAMHGVMSEFEFRPGLGSIEDLKGPIGHCALCGKGDSRVDGANEDKLRYIFRLTNIAGGTDLMVGSSCILHYGLKVKGAQTAEEARTLLAKSLREHIQMWKEAEWREAWPSHDQIPETYKQCVNMLRLYMNDYGLRHAFVDLRVADPEAPTFIDFTRGLRNAINDFTPAMKFYMRRRWLTDKKHDAWIRAAKSLRKAQRFVQLHNAMQGMDPVQRYDFLRREVEREKATQRRQPLQKL